MRVLQTPSPTRGVARFYQTQAELETTIHMHRREVIGATPHRSFPNVLLVDLLVL